MPTKVKRFLCPHCNRQRLKKFFPLAYLRNPQEGELCEDCYFAKCPHCKKGAYRRESDDVMCPTCLRLVCCDEKPTLEEVAKDTFEDDDYGHCCGGFSVTVRALRCTKCDKTKLEEAY